MIIKKHIINHQLILAISDDDLIGKKFEEDDLQSDLTSSFYNGTHFDDEGAKQMIAKARALNIVGKKSMAFCASLGLVDLERVIVISGIPHTQISIQG